MILFDVHLASAREDVVVVVRCATAHLESTASMKAPRTAQLTQLAKEMLAFDGPAVCGGDFNMRDAEQAAAFQLAASQSLSNNKVPTMTDAYVRIHHPCASAFIARGDRGFVPIVAGSP